MPKNKNKGTNKQTNKKCLHNQWGGLWLEHITCHWITLHTNQTCHGWGLDKEKLLTKTEKKKSLWPWDSVLQCWCVSSSADEGSIRAEWLHPPLIPVLWHLVNQVALWARALWPTGWWQWHSVCLQEALKQWTSQLSKFPSTEHVWRLSERCGCVWTPLSNPNPSEEDLMGMECPQW